MGRKKEVFPRPLVWDGPQTQQERVRCLICHSCPMHPAPLRVTLSLHYSPKWMQKRQQLRCDSMYHRSRGDQLSIMSILVILHICIRRLLRKPYSLGCMYSKCCSQGYSLLSTVSKPSRGRRKRGGLHQGPRLKYPRPGKGSGLSFLYIPIAPVRPLFYCIVFKSQLDCTCPSHIHIP